MQTNTLHTIRARTNKQAQMMGETSRQFVHQKQYTGDKRKEATEVTLKVHTRQNMQAGSRDVAVATMTVTSEHNRHITSDRD